MQRILRLCFVCTFFFLLAAYGRSSAQSDLITLEILNIKDITGEMVVSVYNNDRDWLIEGKEYWKKSFEVTSSAMEVKIENLPSGDYAIALFQDVNSDTEFNTNKLGIPKEPYGFSNNLRPIFKSPPFDKAILSSTVDRVSINLIH